MLGRGGLGLVVRCGYHKTADTSARIRAKAAQGYSVTLFCR
ncbi:hypothetical protein [Acetobacter cibinongensis]|nr:hypothetical protein [Acetobacter cibinongensis]